MIAAEYICNQHVTDTAGMFAVFYKIDNSQTFFLPVRNNKEFPEGTHVYVHFSYNATHVTDLEGNLLRKINI